MTITKEDLEKAVKEAVEKETKGLKEKNEELLASQKKLKDENKELKDKTEQTEAEKKKAEDEAALKSGDIEKIKNTLKADHAKEMAKLTEQLTGTKSKLDAVLIDGGISEALVKANVAPQFHPAVKALIKSAHKAELVEKDGKTVANIDGEAIGDFFAKWSQGDQGKHYVAAPDNGGGGSKGSDGNAKGGAVKTVSRTDFDKMTPQQKMDHSKGGGQISDT